MLDPKKILDQLSGEAAEAHQPLEYLYHCELVTPMFGGGVKAGEVDRSMPIRATAIRGQLRFWWRILKRASSDEAVDDAELFRLERDIWGGLGDAKHLSKSAVTVKVANVKSLQTAKPCRFERVDGKFKARPKWESWAGGNAGGYAMYGAQGVDSPGDRNATVREVAKPGLRWDLHVSVDPELSNDDLRLIIDAVRWWATFGGVGARTRRGVGAIRVTADDGESMVVTASEAKHAGALVMFRLEWSAPSAIEAWSKAIDALLTFRSGPGFAKPTGNERPGRSYWPEPDSIRKELNYLNGVHKPKHNSAPAYPRASFGLPIVFNIRGKDEPGSVTIEPTGHKRMASPIIIRPYWDEPTRVWRAAVLRLPGAKAYDGFVDLVQDKKRQKSGQLAWPAPEESAARLEKSRHIRPMIAVNQGRDEGKKLRDPLTAFLQFFQNPERFAGGQS